VVLDLDETAIDNSGYEAGLVVNGANFNSKTWDAWTQAAQAQAIPGVVEFTKYADAKGVKVFYVSNRNADQKEATKRNLQALGFPMGGDVDALLLQHERPEWASRAKGARLAYIADRYRVLLLFGDNIGDFTDRYDGSVAERDKIFEALKAHFGHDWMMLAIRSTALGERGLRSQFKLSDDEKHAGSSASSSLGRPSRETGGRLRARTPNNRVRPEPFATGATPPRIANRVDHRSPRLAAALPRG